MTRDESRTRRPASPKGRPDRQDRRGQTKPSSPKPVGVAAPAPRQRIAKLMARVGLCSRREAEVWILDGRVTLNGTVLRSPATDVGPADVILVDDTPLPSQEKTRLFLFHKPRGLVTSDHDPEGRPTVADFLRKTWPEGPRTVTVGRLDINTEGLLLLTNDGGLARTLELPKTGWMRRYRVRAKGQTDQSMLDALADGVTIDGVSYAGIEATLDRTQGANCWLTMGLREGKNREIKRVLEHIGLEVNRLIRISFGPFQLLDLPEGAVSEVGTRVLRDQLGETLASEANVDFGSEQPLAAELERSDRDRRRNDSRPPSRFRQEKREDEAPAPIRERPQRGARRHVSRLRDESGGDKGLRKRVERTQTEDRHARVITVERLSTVARAAKRAQTRPVREEPAGTKRNHLSPSARGKRERVARSGGDGTRSDRPERDSPSRPTKSDRERASRSESGAGRRGGKNNSDRSADKRTTTRSKRPDGSKVRSKNASEPRRGDKSGRGPGRHGQRTTRNSPKSKR